MLLDNAYIMVDLVSLSKSLQASCDMASGFTPLSLMGLTCFFYTSTLYICSFQIKKIFLSNFLMLNSVLFNEEDVIFSKNAIHYKKP